MVVYLLVEDKAIDFDHYEHITVYAFKTDALNQFNEIVNRKLEEDGITRDMFNEDGDFERGGDLYSLCEDEFEVYPEGRYAEWHYNIKIYQKTVVE